MTGYKSKTQRIIISLVSLLVLIALACASATAPLSNQAPAREQPAAPAAEERGMAQPAEVEKAVGMAQEAPAPLATAAMAAAPALPNAEPYDAMYFESEGVNPFVDTEDDYLSTFAMDVDTGAYTIARRYVTDGYLPPEEAIRVEEFVNYFEQGYPYPPEEEAFAIDIDGAPTPFTENERNQMLRIGIQGYAVAPEERQDMALTFVIDVSGSMEQENRLGLVKEALALLVNQLRPSDTVGIVVYGSQARVVLEPAGGADREEILAAIYRLQTEGSTNAEAGLRLGYDLALQAFKPGAINRVILASDGVANVGQTSAESIWDVVKAKASEGITLTTVGFGMGNYNDVLMEQLADNGDGFYAYVDTLREAERLFVHDLASTLQTIALDAKVQVEFNPEVVERYRLVGFENRAIADESFRDDTVDAGEIGAGHTVTALYEIKPRAEASGRIAAVSIRWEDPESHEVAELSREFYSEDLAPAFSETSPRFQWAVLVAEYAEILRGSYWAQNSSLAAVLEDAQRVSQLLDQDAKALEFVDLVTRAAQIAKAE